MKGRILLAIVLAAVAAFSGGVYVGYIHHLAVSDVVKLSPYGVSFDGLVEVDVSMEPPNVRLDNSCRRVAFDVTADQSLAIYNGLHGAWSVRPLTQDIMKDVLDNFGVKLLQVKIDRYEDEIYYATLTMRRGDDILVLDARPSDSIALALRQNLPVYFDGSLFAEKSVRVC
ncbi:MAG: bifunctional nuclease family protein [Candidatus Aenigmarchaeota archaeon]|nr:bifunctional nuclease family protein [Candidatus Aenigmarchaeota archaeon]